jgi:hypothetical protein
MHTGYYGCQNLWNLDYFPQLPNIWIFGASAFRLKEFYSTKKHVTTIPWKMLLYYGANERNHKKENITSYR